MLFEGGYTYSNFLANVFTIFLFVMWFWLLIGIFGDLFRRDDISGFSKVIWAIFVLVMPLIGILAYLLTQGSGMARRDEAHMDRARESLRKVVGFSVADEIEKLERLKSAGTITPAEYSKLRAKLV